MIPLNIMLRTESYQEEAEISADDFYVKVREQGTSKNFSASNRKVC